MPTPGPKNRLAQTNCVSVYQGECCTLPCWNHDSCEPLFPCLYYNEKYLMPTGTTAAMGNPELLLKHFV